MALQSQIGDVLNGVALFQLEKLERKFDADIFFYFGDLYSDNQFTYDFKYLIDNLANNKDKKDILCFFINTTGGDIFTVEKMVNIIRHHYKKIYFVVPNQAMSAGTILCMSGNRIYMDYASSLGPIDPQVQNKNGIWVPALGYLDEVDNMIKKGSKLSDAEIFFLNNIDLGDLNKYRQSKELAISLVTDWLAKYKFSDWNVNEAKKQERAKEIANILSDNQIWHAHGRMINVEKLKDIKLIIHDYSAEKELSDLIKRYNDTLVESAQKFRYNHLFHTKEGVAV